MQNDKLVENICSLDEMVAFVILLSTRDLIPQLF